MRIPSLNLSGSYFEPRTGEPNKLGILLLRAINALIDRTGGINGKYLPLPESTVADLPTAMTESGLIMCTDESGGAMPVFWDAGASVWRRVTDRAIAS
jgi:hypothetical protein